MVEDLIERFRETDFGALQAVYSDPDVVRYTGDGATPGPVGSWTDVPMSWA
jgi:hypothetical protein